MFKIIGSVTKKLEPQISDIYNRGGKLDYLLLNSHGGDFIAAHGIVCTILAHQPNLPVIIQDKAFSAAAYIFLCLKNRFHFPKASVYIHSIKMNMYSKDIKMLLCKRKYYSKVLRYRVAEEFGTDINTANKWLREGRAFTDSQLTMLLDSIRIKKLEEIIII